MAPEGFLKRIYVWSAWKTLKAYTGSSKYRPENRPKMDPKNGPRLEKVYWIVPLPSLYSKGLFWSYLQSGASACSKALAEYFIKVPQAVGPILQLMCCPNQQWSACDMELSEKQLTKPLEQPAWRHRLWRVCPNKRHALKILGPLNCSIIHLS